MQCTGINVQQLQSKNTQITNRAHQSANTEFATSLIRGVKFILISGHFSIIKILKRSIAAV